MNPYDTPDTTVWLDPRVSSLYSGPGPGVCGPADTACPICEKPAEWLIGGRDRACSDHIGYVLAYAYAALNGLDYTFSVVPVVAS